MSSFSLDFSGDTVTLIVGLVVFAIVRYFVRRQVKSVLENPSEVIKTEEKNVKTECAENTATACCNKTDCCQSAERPADVIQWSESGPLVILYGTTTGTARQFSVQLAARLQETGLPASALTLRDCADIGKNVDEEFAAYAKSRARLVNSQILPQFYAGYTVLRHHDLIPFRLTILLFSLRQLGRRLTRTCQNFHLN
jgi:hypothetical protein